MLVSRYLTKLGTAAIVAIAGTMALVAGPTKGNAQIFPPYPDVIQCTFAGTGVSSGPRIFYILAKQGSTPVELLYRQPRADAGGVNYDILFNATDGSYITKTGVPVATSCDNQSLAQIQTAGAAYFFSGVGGSIPTGAAVEFSLAACPSGWTRQTINTSTIILCQKN